MIKGKGYLIIDDPLAPGMKNWWSRIRARSYLKKLIKRKSDETDRI